MSNPTYYNLYYDMSPLILSKYTYCHSTPNLLDVDHQPLAPTPSVAPQVEQATVRKGVIEKNTCKVRGEEVQLRD